MDYWQVRLENTPQDSSESKISQNLILPLLDALGFDFKFRSSSVSYPNYDAGNGSVRPDYACWREGGSQEKPFLVAEVKKAEPAKMEEAIAQLHNQMRSSQAQFGIATNGLQIQLFQRHGRVCAPRTRLRALTSESIVKFIDEAKEFFNHPRQALTVMFWNNKGGVGKTTLTVNVSAALARKGYSVLAFNFDLQGDLNKAFGIEGMQEYKPLLSIHEALRAAKLSQKKNYNQLVLNREYQLKSSNTSNSITIDIVPGDRSMRNVEMGEDVDEFSLLDLFESGFYNRYDYIFIDASPSWRRIGKLAAYAADIIVTPVDTDAFATDAVFRVLNDFLTEEEIGDEDAVIPRVENYIANSRSRGGQTLENMTQRILQRFGNQISNRELAISNWADIANSPSKGTPVVLDRPNSKATAEIMKVTEKLLLL